MELKVRDRKGKDGSEWKERGRKEREGIRSEEGRGKAGVGTDRKIVPLFLKFLLDSQFLSYCNLVGSVTYRGCVTAKCLLVCKCVCGCFVRYSLTQIAVDWGVYAADRLYYDVLFVGTG